MTAIINIFAVPFGYIMRYIYEFVGNYGVSIILFALLAKVITLPFTVKQKKSMMKTQAIQPKIQALQKKYGKDQQRLNQELQDLYAREDVSPMGGCGTMIISFPIMIGLYYVISQPLTYFMQLSAEHIAQLAGVLGMELGTGYGAQIPLAAEIMANFERVKHIASTILPVDFTFLGFNLAAKPEFSSPSILWVIPILSGLTAFGMSWLTQWLAKRNNPAAQDDAMGGANKMTMLMMPAMSVWIAFIAPAGLGFYWIINNVLSAAQELILNNILQKKPGEIETKPKKAKKEDL